MKIHSDKAWEIASHFSYTLASDTRTLAAMIDEAYPPKPEAVPLIGKGMFHGLDYNGDTPLPDDVEGYLQETVVDGTEKVWEPKNGRKMIDLTAKQLNYLQTLHIKAMCATEAAMNKFPQPNYVLTKIAEEAGEVVRAGVHYAEGRDCTWEDLEGEIVQTIAMCFRLLIEGDQVHGIEPPNNGDGK